MLQNWYTSAKFSILQGTFPAYETQKGEDSSSAQVCYIPQTNGNIFVVTILSQMEVLHLFIHQDHLERLFTVKLYTSLPIA